MGGAIIERGWYLVLEDMIIVKLVHRHRKVETHHGAENV